MQKSAPGRVDADADVDAPFGFQYDDDDDNTDADYDDGYNEDDDSNDDYDDKHLFKCVPGWSRHKKVKEANSRKTAQGIFITTISGDWW